MPRKGDLLLFFFIICFKQGSSWPPGPKKKAQNAGDLFDVRPLGRAGGLPGVMCPDSSIQPLQARVAVGAGDVFLGSDGDPGTCGHAQASRKGSSVPVGDARLTLGTQHRVRAQDGCLCFLTPWCEGNGHCCPSVPYSCLNDHQYLEILILSRGT